jgi:hypothetical protein
MTLESVAWPTCATRPPAVELPLLAGRQFPAKAVEVFLLV